MTTGVQSDTRGCVSAPTPTSKAHGHTEEVKRREGRKKDSTWELIAAAQRWLSSGGGLANEQGRELSSVQKAVRPAEREKAAHCAPLAIGRSQEHGHLLRAPVFGVHRDDDDNHLRSGGASLKQPAGLDALIGCYL